MSGFPKLIPAFTTQIPISEPATVGTLKAGGLNHVSFLTDSGFMKSEPGYPIQLDAVFAHGGDYIRVDPDGKRVRLEVSSLLKDKSGAFVRFDYSGVVPLTGPAGKVLGGAADAKTTEQGEIFAHVTFSSGDAALKVLEDKVYVSSGRFILEDGKPVTVEYRISEVSY